MLALIALLPVLGGGDADVTKVPVGERIAYANQLADRFQGRNAWDHYQNALTSQVETFELSGDDWDSPRAKALRHVSYNMHALAECESWTTADADAIRELLDANKNTLDCLVKATRRQRFFRPLPDDAGRLYDAASNPSEGAAPLGLAKLMMLAANDHAVKWGWEKAYLWNARVHRMANHLRQQPYSFDHLLAGRVQALACRQTLCFLHRHPPESPKDLMERIAEGRDRRCPDEVNQHVEDLLAWDWLEAWHEWAKDPAQHPVLTTVAKMFVDLSAVPVASKEEKDVLGEMFGNSPYKSVADLREAIRGTTPEQEWQINRRLARVHNRWNSRAFHDAWKRVESFERECCDLMKTSPVLSITGCGPMATSHFPLVAKSVEILYDGLRISAAVLDYKRSRGSLPSDLHELTPDFLDRLPEDPFSGGQYIYRVVDGGADFVLYSVWTDQTDGGGKHTNEMRGDGDHVIWPPRPVPVTRDDP